MTTERDETLWNLTLWLSLHYLAQRRLNEDNEHLQSIFLTLR